MGTDSGLTIFVAERLIDSAMARLRNTGQVIELDDCEEAALARAVREGDALIVRTYSQVTRQVIGEARKTNRLKVIARAGVGLDNIDIRAAADAGITVVYAPASSTVAVAEAVVGLIIAVQRKIIEKDTGMRQGQFGGFRRGITHVRELQHQTLGVIGMGRIGRAVGDRLHNGLRMNVIYHDIRDVGWLPFPARSCDSAEAVYRQADVVTMHVPLTNKTRGMISASALSHFKPGAYLINASRGPVVVASALADGLREGRLAGAAVDVFDPEPPPADHPLLSAPNCLLSPHVASRTAEAIIAMNDVVDDVIAVLQGQPPRFPAEPANYPA